MQPVQRFLFAVSALLLPACLTDSYAIRHDELVRIAALPPENRGTHVRATQQTSSSESYDEPDPWEPEPQGPGIVIVSGPGPHVHHHHDPGPVRNSPTLSRRQSARSSPGRDALGRGLGGGSKVELGKGDGASTAAVVAVAALVVGTGAFSAVALTEGPRFDGWLRLSPEQPLLLKPKGGSPYWVPLSDLTSEEVALAENGVVRPTVAQLLERAPLDRVGGATSLELGGSSLRSTYGNTTGGVMVRYGIGGFPVSCLGMLGNAGFTAGDDDGTLFEGRLGLELRLVPLRLGRMHLGSYGELGHAWLLHDVPGGTARGQGMYYGIGGLLEIDLTTRLGLLVRGGAAWLPRYDAQVRSPNDDRPFPELSLGLAVY